MRSQNRDLAVLASVLTAIALLWLGVLPRVARTARLAAAMERLDRDGINPSALFYTDHPRWSPGILPGKRRHAHMKNP